MTTFARSASGLAGPGVTRPKVLYLLSRYPQIGETCIKHEIETLEGNYDIAVVARKPAMHPYADHRPFTIARDLDEAVAAVEAFRPDIIHTHYLTDAGFVGALSRRTLVPFTVRAHSADTLLLRPKGIRQRIRDFLNGESAPERSEWFAAALKAVDSELCLGVLALPFSHPWLIRAGMPAAKLVECFPVMRFDLFHDRRPNGSAVMNPSVACDRKAIGEFLRLARKVPDRTFNLYTAGNAAAPVGMRDAEQSANVNIAAPLQPEAMAAEYKNHRWLVCTDDVDAPASGWPVAIAEAQAAGVGICMPALRPDLAHYIGEGAGILYDTIDELPAIVSGPVPEEMRERGFEQARKSDIQAHKHLLTDLWDAALHRRTADSRTLAETGSLVPPRASAGNAASIASAV